MSAGFAEAPAESADIGIRVPPSWARVLLPLNEDAIRLAVADLPGPGAGNALDRALATATLTAIRDAVAATGTVFAFGMHLGPRNSLLRALLIGSIARSEFRDAEEILRSLLEGPAAQPGVTGEIVDMPAGPTARTEWTSRIQPPTGRAISLLTVQYLTLVPRDGTIAALTFATPALALAGAMRILFHSIALSLRLQDPQR